MFQVSNRAAFLAGLAILFLLFMIICGIVFTQFQGRIQETRVGATQSYINTQWAGYVTAISVDKTTTPTPNYHP